MAVVRSQVVLKEFSVVEWPCLCFLGLARDRTKCCLQDSVTRVLWLQPPLQAFSSWPCSRCIFPLLRPWGGPCGSAVPWEEADPLTWVSKAGGTISSFRVAQPWLQRSPGPGLTAHALEQRPFVGDCHSPPEHFAGWQLRRDLVIAYDLQASH